MRVFRVILVVSGCFCVGAALLAATIALLPQKFLTVDSGDVRADVLVVLGGAAPERPRRAAELYLAGVAPLILVSGEGDAESNASLLEKEGVPPAAIILEERSASTLENARFSVPLLRQRGARRIILVTSWYHSRRALACFEQVAPDLVFYSRPSYFHYPHGLANPSEMTSLERRELVKLPGYWLGYGVRPWPL